MNTKRLQSLGVGLTHCGKFLEAERFLREALSSAVEPVLRASVLRDLADVVRRLGSSRWEEARAFLNESLSILAPLASTYPLQYAYSVHYTARLERQLGEYPGSAANMELARNYILRCLKKIGGTKDERSQRLYIALDYSSILSLNGRWVEAIYQALCALVLTTLYGNSDHKKRAVVLLLFAFLPHTPLPFVRKAFFGGTL